MCVCVCVCVNVRCTDNKFEMGENGAIQVESTGCFERSTFAYQRERERKREVSERRKTQTQTQTDRQTGGLTDRQTDKK